MVFTMNEDNLLLDIFLDFGQVMLSAGGEISRVEDSIARMGVAYGATSTNVFIIPSSIELTITFSDGNTVTRTRRIRTSPSTDFMKLQALNALSRRCAMDCLPVDQLRDEIRRIGAAEPAPYKVYIGSILAGSAFCLFFGGTLLWYAVTAAAFYAACSLFQGRSFLFIFLLSALLSGVRYVIFGFLSTLQDIPWEPALLLDECFLQALLTPFIWAAASALRRGVKHEA